ncbi:anti-sigma factor [Streptomyces sp. NPDC088124]|uniref:anti-sigma factor n=1 Tax=Streptomyces sp. NPDC088124 TaxID=3154654 RepID=UPI0034140E70
MTTADLHTLTGAYALHALAPAERAAFERHLVACHACSQEVRELTATAARLGRAVAVAPPPALKELVLRRIATERQEPPTVTHHQARPGGGAGRGRALSRFALAACLAAVAGLGGVALWQNQEARDARQEARAARLHSEELAAVLAAPDAKVATGGLTNGATGSVIVSRDGNRAAFVAVGMPKAPSGMVYELWYDDGGTMRAAGLLDPTTGSASVLMEGPVNGASGMGITLEPAGGSEQPTSTPLALMNFPAL